MALLPYVLCSDGEVSIELQEVLFKSPSVHVPGGAHVIGLCEGFGSHFKPVFWVRYLFWVRHRYHLVIFPTFEQYKGPRK